MEQDLKQLLLRDLCARLPYGVKLKHIPSGENTVLEMIGCGVIDGDIHDLIDNFRPYLRPMSSMTTEERLFLLKFGTVGMDENDKVFDVYPYGIERTMSVIDFLNACHFDYRGLIPMGLALEAPEGIYLKEK